MIDLIVEQTPANRWHCKLYFQTPRFFRKRSGHETISLTMSAAGKGVSEEGDERALEDWTQETVGIVRQVTLLGVKWVTSWVQPF